MSNYHKLKIWPEYYNAIVYDLKNFEIRKDDRGFMVGDVLCLREWDPIEEVYTDKEVNVRVTYIVRAEDGDFGLKDGYVIMSIKKL